MKKFGILTLAILFFCNVSWAKKEASELPPNDIQSWENYDQFMSDLEEKNREVAWSYIISGSLVTLGGLIGSNSSEDSAMQVILGLSTTSGLAGVSYGVSRLNNGAVYSTLYETLKRSHLPESERWSVIQDYIRIEREKEQFRSRVKLITHLVAAGLNLYAASAIEDQNSKTILNVFAALNVAVAFSYSY